MASPSMQPGSGLHHDRYMVRRKIFAFFAPQFHFYDNSGNLIAYTKQKAFKLKEDIRIYADETMSRELLLIKARKVLDFSSAYDVTDSMSQQKIGMLKRRGLKSILKDEWLVCDAADAEIGKISEDSMLLATIRRFLTNLIPQSFQITVGGEQVGTVKQNWNFFVPKVQVDLSSDPGQKLDRRLAAAAVVLLMAIEGRQG